MYADILGVYASSHHYARHSRRVSRRGDNGRRAVTLYVGRQADIRLSNPLSALEPIFVMLWIFSDYLLISVLLLSLLKASIFMQAVKYKESHHDFLIVVYFLAMILGRNSV
jgi:DNA-binding sugar fermentation-stimulating protein